MKFIYLIRLIKFFKGITFNHKAKDLKKDIVILHVPQSRVAASQKRKCVLIIGMHRSGTSAMSAILQILGLYNKVGIKTAPDNPKGFYEWDRGVEINDKILRSMNSAWDDEKCFHTKRCHKKTNKFKNELLRAIEEDFSGQRCFTIKDPRISVFLPLYIEILESLNVEPLLLIMERPDDEICLSLSKRNGFSREKSLALCKKYKTSIHKDIARYKHIIIQFNDLVSNPVDTTGMIIDRLNLPFTIDSATEKKILDFIDPELKHHNILKSTSIRIASG